MIDKICKKLTKIFSVLLLFVTFISAGIITYSVLNDGNVKVAEAKSNVSGNFDVTFSYTGKADVDLKLIKQGVGHSFDSSTNTFKDVGTYADTGIYYSLTNTDGNLTFDLIVNPSRSAFNSKFSYSYDSSDVYIRSIKVTYLNGVSGYLSTSTHKGYLNNFSVSNNSCVIEVEFSKYMYEAFVRLGSLNGKLSNDSAAVFAFSDNSIFECVPLGDYFGAPWALVANGAIVSTFVPKDNTDEYIYYVQEVTATDSDSKVDVLQQCDISEYPYGGASTGLYNYRDDITFKVTFGKVKIKNYALLHTNYSTYSIGKTEDEVMIPVPEGATSFVPECPEGWEGDGFSLEGWSLSSSRGPAPSFSYIAEYGTEGTVYDVYAHWDLDGPQKYTMRVHSNYEFYGIDAEEKTMSVTGIIGESLTINVPTSWTKRHFTLVKISILSDDDNTNSYIPNYNYYVEFARIGGVYDVYCVWEEDPKYTVTFETNGGTAIDPITRYAGDFLIQPDTPTKSGYRFNGWYSDPECTNEFSFSLATFPDHDMTIYADWYNKYTITYVSDSKDQSGSGDYIIESLVTDEQNLVLSKEEVPFYNEHWYIDLWSTTPNLTVDEMTADDIRYRNGQKLPRNDLVLYPVWAPIKVSVTYILEDMDNITDTSIGDDVVTIRDAIEEPPVGKVQTGWYYYSKIDGVLTEVFVPFGMEVIAKNISRTELRAKYESASYKLTFDLGYDCENRITENVLHYNQFTVDYKPKNPTRDGYVFAGWDVEIPSRMPNEDVYVTALWEEGDYLITYCPNPYVNAKDEKITVGKKTGENITILGEAYFVEGYTQIGWSQTSPSPDSNNYDYAFGANFSLNRDFKLYAIFSKNEITVTYTPDSNTDPKFSEVVQTFTSDIETNFYDACFESINGRPLLGWSTEKDSRSVKYAFGAKIPTARDLVLYPVWELEEYVITYSPGNPATDTPTDKITQTYTTDGGDVFLGLTYSRENANQIGWSVSQIGLSVDYNFGDVIELREDITLYPVWKEDVLYTITYVYDDKTIEPRTEYTQTFRLSSSTQYYKTNIYKSKDYKLVGWTTEKGSDVIYCELGAKVNYDDVTLTLYPVWGEYTEDDKFTIVFNSNYANYGIKKAEAKVELEFYLKGYDNDYNKQVLSELNSGYRLIAWSLASEPIAQKSSPTISYTFDNAITGGKYDVYAVWDVPQEYTLIIHSNDSSIDSSLTDKTITVKVPLGKTIPIDEFGIPDDWGIEGYYVKSLSVTYGYGAQYAPDYTYYVQYGYLGQIYNVYCIWATEYSYNVQFDANVQSIEKTESDLVGSAGYANVVLKVNEKYIIPEFGYTIDGFAFSCWNTKADNTGKKYYPGDEVSNLTTTADGTVTLYAIFVEEGKIIVREDVKNWISEFVYSGRAVVLLRDVVIEKDGVQLVNNKDYTITLASNGDLIKVNETTVIVEGKGTYGGKVVLDLVIKPFNLEDAEVTSKIDFKNDPGYGVNLDNDITVYINGHSLGIYDYYIECDTDLSEAGEHEVHIMAGSNNVVGSKTVIYVVSDSDVLDVIEVTSTSKYEFIKLQVEVDSYEEDGEVYEDYLYYRRGYTQLGLVHGIDDIEFAVVVLGNVKHETTLEEFLSNFKTDRNLLRITSYDGEVVFENGHVPQALLDDWEMTEEEFMNDVECFSIGTGAKVELVKDDTVFDVIYISVLGDIDGDGVYTSSDYNLLREYIKSRKVETLSEEYKLACYVLNQGAYDGRLNAAEYNELREDIKANKAKLETLFVPKEKINTPSGRNLPVAFQSKEYKIAYVYSEDMRFTLSKKAN